MGGSSGRLSRGDCAKLERKTVWVRFIDGADAPAGTEGRLVEVLPSGDLRVVLAGGAVVKTERRFLRKPFKTGDEVLWQGHTEDIIPGERGVVLGFRADERSTPDNPIRLAEVEFEGGKLVLPLGELSSYSYLEARKRYMRSTPAYAVYLEAKEAAEGLFGPKEARNSSVAELTALGITSHRFRRQCTLSASRPDRHHKKKRFDRFRELPEAEHPIWAVAVAPTAKLLAAAAADGSVHMWDLTKLEIIFSIDAHKGTVWALEFSPNECFLVTASADKSVCLWDVSECPIGGDIGSGKFNAGKPPLVRLKGHSDVVRCVSFSLHGLLISGGHDQQLCLWQSDNIVPLRKWKAHEKEVVDVKFSHIYADLAFSMGQDGTVALWRPIDAEEGLICRFGGSVDTGAVLSFDIHPIDFMTVATGTQDGTVWLWFFKPGGNRSEHRATTSNYCCRGHKAAVWATSFSKDGCLLATGSADNTVRVWATHNVVPFQTTAVPLVAYWEAHDCFVKQLRWKSLTGGRSLVTCSVDGTVSLWAAPKQLRKLKRPLPSAKPKAKAGAKPQGPLPPMADGAGADAAAGELTDGAGAAASAEAAEAAASPGQLEARAAEDEEAAAAAAAEEAIGQLPLQPLALPSHIGPGESAAASSGVPPPPPGGLAASLEAAAAAEDETPHSIPPPPPPHAPPPA
eukprot:TRINITY_DN26617_c0_g2_i1.p1 TRINITY_DN26617_c0_g2~~TRINITY_DN26617_c0_g2_i1.p1  ORF type:complete len:683 (+),score=175.22 TRINITY_DN26617_c0_g2_i1:152-2200(+)